MGVGGVRSSRFTKKTSLLGSSVLQSSLLFFVSFLLS